jgi:hypothetical protein
MVSARSWGAASARGAEQLGRRVGGKRHLAQLERAQCGYATQRRSEGARAGRVKKRRAVTAADAERAQAAPGFRPERLEVRRIGLEDAQLLEARPAARRWRARGIGGLEAHLQLCRRLVDRVAELGVHELQRLAVLEALQRADDERGGGGRARERLQHRQRVARGAVRDAAGLGGAHKRAREGCES